MHYKPHRRAVIWVHWGDSYLSLLERSVRSAISHVDADRYVISDVPIPASIHATNVIYPFKASGFMRKPEVLSQIIPGGHSVFLFLDSDTVVLDNVDFGFEQAAKHGLAISIASNYSLADYYGSSVVMRKEGISFAGPSLYNSGVIFYRNSSDVVALFEKWRDVASRSMDDLLGDQEALTIAMLATDFNPYVLSKSFNVRGILEVLSGRAYIWHGKAAVPEGINSLAIGDSRRILVQGRLRPMTQAFLAGGALALVVRKVTDRLYVAFRRGAQLLGWSPR